MNNLMIRNSVQLPLWVLAFALLFAVDPAWGGEESVVESGRKISALEAKQYVLLEAHEPNRLGWTKDNDDDGFMDFLVSIQHPFAYESRKDSNGEWLAYFAFT